MRYDTAVPLGSGGVGEVFRAYDPALQRYVALKYLRRDDPELAERLLREARLQARVNHDLVCKVYEVGSDDGRPFIAMQYIDGRTLEAAAAELGLEDKLRIVAAVAGAVHAAHELGLVHRDLKPQNIMLERREAGEWKPYVLDFGLARERQTPGLTDTGVIAGTPSYMAPEQARGQVHALDRRTDVYALGAVLYRLLAGRPPFEGRSDLEVAMRVVQEEPPSLRRAAPGSAPAELETIVLKCLEKDPARRYATALDLAADLQRFLNGERVGARRAPWPTRVMRRVRRSPGLAAALAVATAALLTGAVLVGLRSPWSGRGAERGPLQPRRAFAVLGLKNVSGRPDAAWVGVALSEMLTTELGAGGRLRAIPGETVARVRAEMALPEADALARDTLFRLHESMGADLVLVGSYLLVSAEPQSMVRLDLRLQDAAGGETVALAAETGSAAQLPELVSRLGASLRRTLALQPLSSAEEATLRGSFTTSPEATRLHAEGLARLRAFDAQGARVSLEAAVAREPRSAPLRLALSEAWGLLGYQDRARDEARLAFESAGGLPRDQGLLVEGHYRGALNDWERALEIYKTLFVFFPDNVEYGLKLADAQTRAGRGELALKTVEGLRQLRPPENEDPRIDIAEGDAADLISDYDRELRASERALQRAQARGARLLAAQAGNNRGWALMRMGRYPEALSAFDAARGTFAELGDRWGAVRSSGHAANVQWEQGDLDGAKRTFLRILPVARQLGNVRGVAVMLNNLANIVSDQGSLIEAAGMYEQALVSFREVGDRTNVGNALNNLATLAQARGDIGRARQLASEAVALRRELGDTRGVISSLTNLSVAQRTRGELPAARASADEATALGRTLGNPGVLAQALEALGELQFEQGDRAGARRSHQEALGLRETLGQAALVATSQLDLAELELEERQAAEAERLARASALAFRAERRRDDEAEALALLGRAQLVLGRPGEAARSLEAAEALVRRSESPWARLRVLLARAEQEGAAAQRAEALHDADEVEKQAAAAGNASLAQRARLLRAGLERAGAAGDAASPAR